MKDLFRKSCECIRLLRGKLLEMAQRKPWNRKPCLKAGRQISQIVMGRAGNFDTDPAWEKPALITPPTV